MNKQHNTHGECETCGEWDEALYEGMCPECREKYRVSAKRDITPEEHAILQEALMRSVEIIDEEHAGDIHQPGKPAP